jgi:HlyD family secretion protein
MTAVVEIHVKSLPDVLTVPVQAVVSRGSERWCYVAAKAGGVDRREIELGPTNDRHVQVTKGIREGDRVVLNPISLADQEPVRKEQTKEKTKPKAKSKKTPAKKSG